MKPLFDSLLLPKNFANTPFVWVIIVISLAAMFTDLRSGKIYNWLTLPALFLGLTTAAFGATGFGGAIGIVDALFGIGLGLILLGWMFALGMLGGGDVKFVMALGALGGAHFVIEATLLAILVGGIFALGSLVARGRFFGPTGFAHRIYRFIFTAVTPNLEVEFVKVDRSETMPFGVPLAIAASWTAIAPPLARWGLRLWA